MGVRRKDFVVVGANIGREHYDDEKYEDEFVDLDGNTKIGEMTYLIDGYEGKYFIVGQVLASDKDGYNGIKLDLSTISDEEMAGIKQKVYVYIKDTFGVETSPSVIVQTHWT